MDRGSDEGWDDEPAAGRPEAGDGGWGDGPPSDWTTPEDQEEPDFDALYDAEMLAAIEAGPSRAPGEPVTRVSQWRRRSALGAVLTGLALGLQEVFDPEDERSIVVEVDDDGMPTDLPVQMFLDPDSPAGSLCIVHRTAVKPPMV